MNKWTEYCVSRPNLHLTKTCTDNIPPQQFWSPTGQYPDLVYHLHVQVRFMGNLGFNAGVPWLSDTHCPKCFICKTVSKMPVTSFLIACPSEKTSTTLLNANFLESNFMFRFSENLDQKHKTVFLMEVYIYHSTVKQLLSRKDLYPLPLAKFTKYVPVRYAIWRPHGLKSSNFLLFSFLISYKLLYFISFYITFCKTLNV